MKPLNVGGVAKRNSPLSICTPNADERRKLVKSLRREGISWQGRTERKGLAMLLGNKKAMGPLLEFLKSTEVVEEKEQGRMS